MKSKKKEEAAKATAMIPLALHSAMLDKLNKLGGRKSDYSQQWLIETLIKEWIAGDRKIESKPPPRYQDDLDNLGLIMESGTPSQKRTIHGPLKDYSDGLEIGRKPEVVENPTDSHSTLKPRKKAG